MSFSKIVNKVKTKTLLISLFLTYSVAINVAKGSSSLDSGNSQIDVEQLPFCGDSSENRINNNQRLAYISTLDGKLSALDITNNGELKWSIETEPGPLLSSSIHRLELTNNGQWVRMIPSLSGGIYQFDGESIEPIPITADNLLSSSFKFSDDLVISGGKESRSYGVSTKSGKLIYECSMHGCKNHTELNPNNHDEIPHNPAVDDIIVVRRQTQTVRAVEPRSGVERWNFSVGHHELEIVKSENCHNTDFDSSPKSPILDLELKIVVPEGIVCAVSKTNPRKILWKYKFDYPITSAWQSDENKQEIQRIDLFSSSTTEWLTNPEYRKNKDILISPSVYVGMFKKQLYIQENDHLSKIIHNNHQLKEDFKYPQIPWKPYPATSSALALIENDESKDKRNALATTSEDLLSDSEPAPTVTALSVLYGSEYVNGNGFFLYTSNDLNKSQSCDSEEHEREKSSDTDERDDLPHNFPFDNETTGKIVIISLWFWWKEITVLIVSLVIIMNLFCVRNTKEIVVVERHVEVPIIVEKEISSVQTSRGTTSRSLSESQQGAENFSSRFLSDFDLVRCLGKGGFGVVFEVRNKLDDCNYAIKRIQLPNKQESRDRVMREVKTLANCEHQNIVRYFQAWVETPPNGWQEKQDKILFERDALSTSIDMETPTEEPSSSKHPVNYLVDSELIKRKNLDSWITHLNTNECINFDDEQRKTKFTKQNDADSGLSFIQFRHDTDLSNSSLFNKSKINNHSINNSSSFDIVFKDSTKNDSYSSSKDHKNHIISIPSNGTNTTASETTSDNKILIPFKKTHRRPLSLDLTSKGKVVPITSSNKVYLYIQMQLCKKQSLRDWLRMNDLNRRQIHIYPIFEQIVKAVEYVHLKGLIHRDLKPSNIFFSLDNQIKIGDFGLVTDMSDIPNIITSCGDETGLPSCAKHTEQVGTHLYMSPEQLQGKPYNYKVDIYSLGLILFELLIVFSTEMERIETLKKLRNNLFPDDFQKSFTQEYELLRLMLSQHPSERPTTLGIRARPPLQHTTDEIWHFELPPRRNASRTSSLSISSSSNSLT